MPALVAGIPSFFTVAKTWMNKDVDGRNKAGHDTPFLLAMTKNYPCFGQYSSRRWRFTSLPVGVRGSSARKSMLFGHLIGDRYLRQ